MRIRLLVCCALFSAGSQLFAQDNDFETLKAQVMQLQKNYESRISALEKKIEQLQTNDLNKTITINELKQRNQQQEETIAALSLGNIGTNATTDILALSRQNEADISAIQEQLSKRLSGLEYHGYLRSGFGTSGNGEIQPAFQAPGAAKKYRLGNEAETYLEMAFKHSTQEEQVNNDKMSVDTQVRMALSTPMDNSAAAETTTSLREAFANAHGAIRSLPDIDFWAGQRFYNRYSIHIDDFHFYDMAGSGGGVENIPISDTPATLSIAWIGGSTDKLNSDGSVVTDNDFNLGEDTLNVGVHGIPMLSGKLDILGAYSAFNGDTIEDEEGTRYNLGDSNGGSLALIQMNKWEEWDNTFAVMYGAGPAYNFQAVLTRPAALPIANVSEYDINDFRTTRVLNNLTRNIDEHWVLSAVLLYEDFDSGEDRYDWYSGGLRPIYHFNDTFALAVEGSVDHSSAENVQSGELYKLTLAPMIRPNISFLSRPELRLFVTYAWWSDEFEDYVGGSQYRGDTAGLSAGIQLETWW